ncbi:MAG: ATP-binding protein [Bacteroidota bacterium]
MLSNTHDIAVDQTDQLHAFLVQMFQDLQSLIEQRIKAHFSNETLPIALEEPYRFPQGHAISPLLEDCPLCLADYYMIALSLAPHIQPQWLDAIISANISGDSNFLELGGQRGKQFRGMIPTGETVLFLLAGNDLSKRLQVQKHFHPDYWLNRKRVLYLASVEEGEPQMAGKLILSQEYQDILTQGYVTPPRFSLSFPAQRIETALEWEDLVLNPKTIAHIRDLETWVNHHQTLMEDWGMKRKLKPGYRVLFHGPPGTGKTLTASLLGKYTGKDVYKIDLSMIVSKFIGETEKNLSNLFARAENKDWILFFDEADALFGKRTQVRDAHDKYANQEVSYLLQRVETYNGLVILATNFKNNIDEAFIRRFHGVIHFPLPASDERQKLWEAAFPPQIQLSPEVDFANLAQKYELSGAEIMNIMQYCCLRSLENGNQSLKEATILQGIRREYLKEGRIMR